MGELRKGRGGGGGGRPRKTNRPILFEPDDQKEKRAMQKSLDPDKLNESPQRKTSPRHTPAPRFAQRLMKHLTINPLIDSAYQHPLQGIWTRRFLNI